MDIARLLDVQQNQLSTMHNKEISSVLEAMMKSIDVLVTTYNEEASIEKLVGKVTNIFETQLPEYKYRIVIIDNDSVDNTRAIVENICAHDNRVCAIFNASNFGQVRSMYHGLINTDADATIQMAGDLQDPPEIIPELIQKWECGHNVVIGKKTKSKENKLMYFIRSSYYTFMEKISETKHIPHFTCYALFDRSFINILKQIKGTNPYLKGLVAELGGKLGVVEYVQEKREGGKSSYNFYRLYDIAMLSITSSSRALPRIATMMGFAISAVSIFLAFAALVVKLIWWNAFAVGTASVLISIFFFGGIQLSFIGLIGEYVMSISQKLMDKPLVVEERRINF